LLYEWATDLIGVCCCCPLITLDQPVDRALIFSLARRVPYLGVPYQYAKMKMMCQFGFLQLNHQLLPSRFSRQSIDFMRESYPCTQPNQDIFCCDMLSRGSFDATVMCLPPTSPINSELSLHDWQGNSCKVQQRPEARGLAMETRDRIRCRVRQGGWKRGVRLPLPRLPVGI